jgi:hypothetical protein
MAALPHTEGPFATVIKEWKEGCQEIIKDRLREIA